MTGNVHTLSANTYTNIFSKMDASVQTGAEEIDVADIVGDNMVTSGEGDRFDVEFALVEEPRHLEPGDRDIRE